jgi:ribonuclease R/exosome complex exonuclease DIS3/RRP44
MNKNGDIKEEWFGKTITESDVRLSYEEAQHIIETGEVKIPKENTILKKEKTVTQKTVEAITTLNSIAKTIRKKRINNGAIIFDKTEIKFKLDKKNQPEKILFKTTKSSNKLIEEFMLLANRKVAEKMRKSKERFVYRVHDQPDQEKLKNLQTVVKRLGYNLKLTTKELNDSLNSLLKNAFGLLLLCKFFDGLNAERFSVLRMVISLSINDWKQLSIRFQRLRNALLMKLFAWHFYSSNSVAVVPSQETVDLQQLQ